MKVVIALGGNMISDASNKKETYSEQLIRVANTARIITEIISAGHQVVLTHGNGPQVGSLLLQQQVKTEGAIQLPLNILGALTQGQIGIMLQHGLINEFNKQGISSQVVIIPTSVFVDKNDPGFQNPTKPIGPFYTKEEYNNLDKTDKVYKELPLGYRRVVASPIPKKILETSIIEGLINEGHFVIAVGGGGSPTIEENGRIKLVDAVIDKDLASSVLAANINADMLLILTNVEGVYHDFGGPNQELLSTINLAKAEELLKDDGLGAGSMRPKVLACTEFVKTGKKAAITSPEFALQTIKGTAGTTIIP